MWSFVPLINPPVSTGAGVNCGWICQSLFYILNSKIRYIKESFRQKSVFSKLYAGNTSRGTPLFRVEPDSQGTNRFFPWLFLKSLIHFSFILYILIEFNFWGYQVIHWNCSAIWRGTKQQGIRSSMSTYQGWNHVMQSIRWKLLLPDT